MLRSVDPDAQFFVDHPTRQARIRLPTRGPVINAQRSVRISDELQGEFWSLGEHDKNRRRIIVYRLPKDNPRFSPERPQLLKIPFLAFADETIEDRDDVLLPIIHDLMLEGAKKHGVG